MRDRLLLAALKTVPTSLAEHVTREFLDILPRLQQVVWIRVQDIFFPHDYPAEWLMNDRHAWNEQYSLEAFIVNAIDPQGSASFWMTRVA